MLRIAYGDCNALEHVPACSKAVDWPPAWLRVARESEAGEVPQPVVGEKVVEAEPTTAPAETSPAVQDWPPRDPRLSTWPIPVRQTWADRVVEHEAAGLGWREAEALAFRETLARVEAGELSPESAPLSLTRASAPATTSTRRRPEPAEMFPS